MKNKNRYINKPIRIEYILFGLIVLFFLFNISDVNCDNDESKMPDSICYKLKFFKNDTLIYKIYSFDSIIINYDTPLIKKRYEKLQIVCDSITPIGTFILKQQLIDFKSYESMGDEKDVERSSTQWLNRVSIIEIDSLGKRIFTTVEDTTLASLCPGGAFQPYLLFPFSEGCKYVGESWIISSEDILVENGLPVPVLKYSSFFRAKKSLDTLGELCNRFEYINTGQGRFELVIAKDTFLVTNIISGFGIMDISVLQYIPIHYFGTLEQKLTLNLPNGSKQPGKHFIRSYYTLSKLIRNK